MTNVNLEVIVYNKYSSNLVLIVKISFNTNYLFTELLAKRVMSIIVTKLKSISPSVGVDLFIFCYSSGSLYSGYDRKKYISKHDFLETSNDLFYPLWKLL